MSGLYWHPAENCTYCYRYADIVSNINVAYIGIEKLRSKWAAGIGTEGDTI